MSAMTTTVPAYLLPETPAFLDELTPGSGLSLRRWDQDEYHRMAYPVIFGPEERTELIQGEVKVQHEGVPRLFTRDEYHRLARHGILKPEERTELIYGRVIQRMSPMGRPHNVALVKAADVLRAIFHSGFTIETQMPVCLSTLLEPEPDVAVMSGRAEDYPDAPPSSAVVLLVEVSETTLRYDRGAKAEMYAKDNIPDYWIVNLQQRTLEVRRQPENGKYTSLAVYRAGEVVTPLAAPGRSVSVADLLPLVRANPES